MIDIAICDDDEKERKHLGSAVRMIMTKSSIAADLSVFSSPEALMDAVKSRGGFNLYLLDVLMPEMNGITLGLRIRESDPSGIIVYLTSSADYAVSGYEVRAFRYLIKPVSEQKLSDVILDALEQSDDAARKKLVIRTKDSDILLSPDDIYYVESAARFPYYVTKNGRIKGLMLRAPFKDELSELLAMPQFRLCGASFIINLSYIKAVENTGIVLENGTRLTLPRIPLRDLRMAWTNYWLEA